MPEDVLPAWVADMDLGVPEPVRRALVDAIELQDLGYPYWPGGDPVVDAFERRMRHRHDWHPVPGRTRVLSDLIQALQVVIEHTTRPGDAVALHVPSYPPFLASIARAGRRIVPLGVHRGDARWELDPVEQRRLVDQHRPSLIVLVNPHNPSGRVLERHELEALADVAVEHRIPVLADEIHSDLSFVERRHIPFASLSRDTAELTITVTSPGKAFNLAGMRCAVMHVGHEETAARLDRAPLDYFGTPSVLSRIAAAAAWTSSEAWLEDVRHQLTQNRRAVTAWVERRPDVDFVPPEATYLAWLDFSRSAFPTDAATELSERAKVQLSPGAEFSQHTPIDTSGFARLNFATSPSHLEEILSRLDGALDSAQHG